MYFRTVVSVFLTAAINLSLCTGGVLSSATVFAAELPQYEEQVSAYSESIPMTFALLQYMSCSVNENGTTVTETHTSTGCADRETCIQQTHEELTQRTVQDSGSVISSECIIHSQTEILNEHSEEVVFQTRDGPLYEQSSDLVHSILKRE